MTNTVTNSEANPESNLRVGIAQLNSIVGDIPGNIDKIISAAVRANTSGCSLVVFPEMAVTGYPIEDLALNRALQESCDLAASELAERLTASGLGHITIIVGTLGTIDSQPANQALVISDGQVRERYTKRHLPTYGVFDEGRVFTPGSNPMVVPVGAAISQPDQIAGAEPLTTPSPQPTQVAVTICEDLWQATQTELTELADTADLIVSLNASPFEVGKSAARIDLAHAIADTTKTPLIYVNAVGTQDELIFDGHSLVVGSNGTVLEGPGFLDTVLIADLDLATGQLVGHSAELINVADFGSRSGASQTQAALADIYLGLVQSVRDFVEKCGLSSVALGLSGGIDSALVAAIAVDALGPDKVVGLSMPSEHSSDHSISDAAELAARTGIRLRTVPIAPLVENYRTASTNGGIDLTGLAEENLQARLRGVLLMAMSNSEGPMVLATGNKSELAVGYSTIYGDAVGGYAPLKDVYKTLVWDLARWRNDHASEFENSTPPIPANSITKPPSAELRPGQLDTDSLPDYEVLDAILNLYIDQRAQVADIVALGFDEPLVREIIAKTDLAEYKRRQYPPGPKVTAVAFGRDRRLPISNHFK